ncbi:MAG: alpha/beta hydrolase [Pseudomonadota bacterium]
MKFFVVGLLVLAVVLVGLAVLESSTLQRQARDHPPPGIFVNLGDRALHTQCAGDADAPLLLLETGAGASSLDWASVMPLLARNFRVCAYDRAGFGWSERAPGARSFDAIAADFDAFWEAVAPGRDAILVGHSLGGLFVQGYARRYPNRVRSIVIVDGLERQLAGAMVAQSESQVPILRLGAALSRLGIPRRLSLGKVPANAPQEVQDAMRARLYRAGSIATVADEAEALGGMLGEIDALPPLSDDLPVLVLARSAPRDAEGFEKDWQDAQARLGQLTDQTELTILPTEDHHLQFAAPEQVAAQITAHAQSDAVP